MSMFFPGTPRIALLDATGVKVKTLFLPPPDKVGGVTLEWAEKGTYRDLYDGSEFTRRYGWIPQVVLKWGAYNDVLPTLGLTIGGLDGNLADMDSLLGILDAPIGCIRFSPGPRAGGFLVKRVVIAPIGVAGGGIATGLQLTLRGGDKYSAKILEAF